MEDVDQYYRLVYSKFKELEAANNDPAHAPVKIIPNLIHSVADEDILNHIKAELRQVECWFALTYDKYRQELNKNAMAFIDRASAGIAPALPPHQPETSVASSSSGKARASPPNASPHQPKTSEAPLNYPARDQQQSSALYGRRGGFSEYSARDQQQSSALYGRRGGFSEYSARAQQQSSAHYNRRGRFNNPPRQYSPHPPVKAYTSAKNDLPKQTSGVSSSKKFDKEVSGAPKAPVAAISSPQHSHSDVPSGPSDAEMKKKGKKKLVDEVTEEEGSGKPDVSADEEFDKEVPSSDPSEEDAPHHRLSDAEPSGPSDGQIMHEMMKKNSKGEEDVLDEVKEDEAKQAQFSKDITSRCEMYYDADSAHIFWLTQPMETLKDIPDLSIADGPIVSPSEVRQDPYALSSQYEWTECDLKHDVECSQVVDLFTQNFSDPGLLRDIFSKDFLRWALQPPNYYPRWHFGVCLKESKELVGFIGGVPSRVRVRGNDDVVNMAAVKVLCVHEKYRSQKLAEVMIQEMTRRVQSENIWQGIFSSDVIVPTPVSFYRYWTRALNVKKLISYGVWKPPGDEYMSVDTVEELYKLPRKVVTRGFRKMIPDDVTSVTHLIREYLSQFEVAEDFTSEQVQHFLLPREGVFHSYVVLDKKTSSVTDFCSFYIVNYSLKGHKEPIKFAYSFYNVATTIPLVQLLKNALVMAKRNEVDSFLATDTMGNGRFFDKLKFECTPIINHFYLYNYRLKSGVKPEKLGVLLL
ncbi:Glycylpeptide N-tetradecanoyltransferase [Raphanus sativus]|nr:Glycylpeptide N-tetradecanoyltransferase [Raphanus sativus]